MESIENISSFILTGILLNLTPGQDTMYILGRSISQGRRAGILSALGISTGGMIHTLAAGLGLSAILMASSTIFNIIKYVGAGYLVYLGIKMLISKSTETGISTVATGKTEYAAIYRQGIFTNLLNPKVALFFLAFLPQFVSPANTHGPIPFFLLGTIFLTTGTIWCLILAIFSSYATQTLRHNRVVKMVMEKLSGCLFILLGVKLAFEKR